MCIRDDHTIEAFDGDYFFLSNFYPCEVEFEGVRYMSVEHAYQAAKTTDPELRKHIAAQPTAARAKKEGRKLAIRPDWDDVKEIVMWQCLWDKFNRHAHLKKLLRDTGDQKLVEGNWWGDTYWGVCNGVGKNRLGTLLTTVRNELCEETA